MRGLIKLIVFIAILVGLVAVASLFIDPKWEVKRSVDISGSGSTLYEMIDTPREWQNWTVWNPIMDKSMKLAFDGPDRGVGAISKWTSDSGNGQMTITHSDPAKGIQYKVKFGEFPPLVGNILVKKNADSNYTVQWSTGGETSKNPIEKLMTKFSVAPRMGRDFEDNLRGLKNRVEGGR